MNKNWWWFGPEVQQEFLLLQISATMLKTFFLSYVKPLVQQIFPFQVKAKFKLKPVRRDFEMDRKNIAVHVKSVFEKVKVYVVSDAQLCDRLVEQCMLGINDTSFIGLDCEWQSHKKTGVALIQVSCGSHCILYQLSKAEDVIPSNLKEILEDRKILKFGVDIQEDARRLKFCGIHVSGFVDLRNLARRCLPKGEAVVEKDGRM